VLYVSSPSYILAALCTVYPQKKQSQLLFSVASSNRPNFWHRDLRDNRESVCPPHLAKRFRQVIHFDDKQNTQTVEPQIKKLSALT